MKSGDDVTVMMDNNGRVIFIVPNVLIFDSVDEFGLLLEKLAEETGLINQQDSDYIEGESDIESDYSVTVIEEWNQELEKSGISGQQKQNQEP